MSNPTTAANPLHLYQFATRSWRVERSAGDVSHQQFEPLLARWNQARSDAGRVPSYLDVHIGVLLHSYLNVDDWLVAVARAFAAADGRYLNDTWPPGSFATREGIILTPQSDPDALVTVDDAGPLAELAAAGPEKVPGPADVDPALVDRSDPADPSSASWALGNLGSSTFGPLGHRWPDESADVAPSPPPATLHCLGAADDVPRPPLGIAGPALVNGKRPLRLDEQYTR